MKQLFVLTIWSLAFSIYGKSQMNKMPLDAIKVVVENARVKVTEYISTPGKDVCGKGKHTHAPHLSIFLTDAHVELITDDGKTQNFDEKAGTAFWSEAETHMVINNGNKPAKVYLVELK
jgi:hypothetical protein